MCEISFFLIDYGTRIDSCFSTVRSYFSFERKMNLNNVTHSLKVFLKCYYDQILDIHFFTFSHTIGVSKISCQISIYYERQNSCFLNLSFREFTAAINFPSSKSGLRIGENDVIFSKISHGLTS